MSAVPYLLIPFNFPRVLPELIRSSVGCSKRSVSSPETLPQLRIMDEIDQASHLDAADALL